MTASSPHPLRIAGPASQAHPPQPHSLRTTASSPHSLPIAGPASQAHPPQPHSLRMTASSSGIRFVPSVLNRRSCRNLRKGVRRLLTTRSDLRNDMAIAAYHPLSPLSVVWQRSASRRPGAAMRAVRLIRGLPGALTESIGNGTAAASRWPVWKFREPLRSYVIALPALAILATCLTVPATRWHAQQLAVFTALIACAAIAVEATRSVHEPRGTVFRDLQSVWYLAIAIALPPFFAFAAPIPLTAYKLVRVPRMASHRRVFSNATLSLAYG